MEFFEKLLKIRKDKIKCPLTALLRAVIGNPGQTTFCKEPVKPIEDNKR